MDIKRTIGNIEGVVVGDHFSGRLDVMRAKLHQTNQKGISWLADVGDGLPVADAIVLNGGYVDDDDRWTTMQYTGASEGKDRDAETGRLRRSQSWSYVDNAALKRSYERKYPIRVIRGYEGDKRYSPPKGYRYDGLFEIKAIRTGISKWPAPDGSEIKICQFDLERIPDVQQSLTPLELRVAEMIQEVEEQAEAGEERYPQVRTMAIRRLIRSVATSQRVKNLYGGECQLCGLRILGPDGKPHSQGAHIKPLGDPHGGPDVEPNILCVCPNCHVRLDVGAVIVDEDWSIVVRADLFGAPMLPMLRTKGWHRVHPDYLRYHREWWASRGDHHTAS
ncbi:YDG/SRA domain-containing protein [Streptomyces hilarionis]|uniref:YDG/SRA domain-containing protein n=1 Tax=Streptomyces hilarionis TaxID=2839954 RepID=UPI00211A61D9|nr:YDG/SRA domain-containing protein [Streptomyces hilarionis]MCQ9135126.1 HNH endonuclease [Streptomyces hilarionis]